ncbi:transposase [Okeania sp. SIO2B3]|uniref:transposase n=1 Tax=Okeania sp. SIO2B3 TaxID=2607784 RepID=UPI0013BF847C|nr:transposase [Okeania sp. SIO2B3]NET42428.1 transposase [Okeania sp. SIO2B3]
MGEGFCSLLLVTWLEQLSNRLRFLHYLKLKNTPKTTDVVGVDLGVKMLATLSTGQVFPSIKPYRTAQDQLAKLQRQLSRKVKHSNNWYKAVIKLAIAAQTSS